VVENEPYASSGMDPFAEASTRNPVDDEPVVSDEDIWVTDGSLEGLGVGAGGSGDGSFSAPSRAAAKSIQLIDPSEADMPDLAILEATLKAGGNPVKAYLATKAGKLRPDRFYIETARRLFAAGHDALAMRVLSTLLERGRDNAAARRAAAFWLMEFGQPAAAAHVLRDAPVEKGDLPVEFALAETAGSEKEAAELLAAAVRACESLRGAVIALTELNRLDPKSFPATAENLPCDVRITVQSEFANMAPSISILHPAGTLQDTWRQEDQNAAPDDPGTTLSWQISPIGGRLISAPGIAEFAIREAAPGSYRVRITAPADTTYRIAIHTNWGKESQQTVRTTRWVQFGSREIIGGTEFEFRPAEK